MSSKTPRLDEMPLARRGSPDSVTENTFHGVSTSGTIEKNKNSGIEIIISSKALPWKDKKGEYMEFDCIRSRKSQTYSYFFLTDIKAHLYLYPLYEGFYI